MLAPTLIDSDYLLAPENPDAPLAAYRAATQICEERPSGHTAVPTAIVSAVPEPCFSHGKASLLAFPAPKHADTPAHYSPAPLLPNRLTHTLLTMTLPMPGLGCQEEHVTGTKAANH